MKRRCLNPKASQYRHYGGRGIKVCERWILSFEAFLADMGNKPSTRHTIERKDNNGNYEPNNCYWATRKEQALNQRKTLRLTYNGITDTPEGWSLRLGISARLLRMRLWRGWTIAQALETPKHYRGL